LAPFRKESYSSSIKEIVKKDDWISILKSSSSRPVVVKFTASWFKTPQKVLCFYEEISKCYDACFIQMNLDNFDKVCDKYHVKIMPTFFVFRYENIVGRSDGPSKFKLIKLMEMYCNPIRNKSSHVELQSYKKETNDLR